MTQEATSVSTLNHRITLITKKEQYYTWAIYAQSNLYAASLKWTIQTLMKLKSTVESMSAELQDIDIKDTNVIAKEFDIIKAHKKYDEECNRAISYFQNAVDSAEQNILYSLVTPLDF